MSYTQVPTRTTSDTNSAADVNQLQANIEALKGGTGATAPTTTIEALSTSKQDAATAVTMAAAGGADELLYTSGADRAAAKSGITRANTVTNVTGNAAATGNIIVSAGTDKTVKDSGINAIASASDYFVSSAVCANADGSVTNSSYQVFSPDLTITFTPNYTGVYKIWSTFQVYSATTSQNAAVIVAKSSGTGETVIHSQECRIYFVSSNVCTVSPYTLVTLVGGNQYTFKVYGKMATGTLVMAGVCTTNGYVIVAEKIK